MKKTRPKFKGVTLIEVLLYIAIASSVLLSISMVFSTVISVRERGIAAANLDQEAQLIMIEINNSIRDADSIESPIDGEDSNSIDILTETGDSISYYLTDNDVYFEDGSGSDFVLNSSDAVVNSLSFQDMSVEDKPQVIRVEMTLSASNAGGRSEKNVTRSFYTTSVVRR